MGTETALDASAAAEAFRREIAADRVVVDPDILASLAHDQTSLSAPSLPLLAVRPRTTAEVSAALRVASDLRMPVVPRGAGSGLAGGANALDGGLVLCLDRMDAIREVDDVERLAVVEAGVLNQALKDRVAAESLWYPPDPASAAISTIGGNVATNAGGLCCVRYGVTSQYVLGLTVVLADGRVTSLGRRTAKGVAGLDLAHLVVGSEGTLAVVTEVVLRLLPARRPVWTMAATFPSMRGCGAAVVALRRAGVELELLEVMDATTLRTIDEWRPTQLGDSAALLLAQLEVSPAGLDDDPGVTAFRSATGTAGADDVMVAADEAEAAWLLDLRTLAYPALARLGTVMLDDVCVPIRALPELVTGIEVIAARREVTIGTFGHAGDGNLHPTIVVPPDTADRATEAFDDIVRLAQRLGGTSTGEHGIGALKIGHLPGELDETSRALMRRVKAAFDPSGLLNPGRGIA